MTDLSRNSRIHRIINQCRDGLLTDLECWNLLDQVRVRGGFNGRSYTGYDYQEQRWIES